MAALFGFLFYNWHPSRLFMGIPEASSSGSTWHSWASGTSGTCPPPAKAPPVRPVITTLMKFPAADGRHHHPVTINRLLRGQFSFVGGRDHTTHHLGYAGFSGPRWP